MACVAVLSLMRTLELEFLQDQPRPILQQKELISCNEELVQSLHEKLGDLMELFDENRMDGIEAIKILETRLRNIAFQTENEIELQVVHLCEKEVEELETLPLYKEMPQGNAFEKITHHCPRLEQILHPATGKSHPFLKFRRILHRANEEIDVIEKELEKVKTTLDATPTFDVLLKMDGSSKHASHYEGIMIGKDNEFETIRKKLVEHPSKELEVVSIQGMAGIGKTALARRVYKDSLIASHFDKRAWGVASQHHSKRQMLEALLDLSGKAEQFKDEELAERLYKSLKQERYLVVIDDIWSTEAWNDVKSCFPNDRNGSRVLLTTRITEVASYACSDYEFSHQMDFLDQCESWNLFSEKAGKSLDAEFETIGRLVVEKCKGLPLAIIVVAGLFSKLNTLDEWKETANALISSSSTTILDDDECSRIFSMSYNHLPHTLKACFLYLGVFPEDYEFHAYHLARLWFAEGLAQEFENESYDAVADRYIDELMDRNLIIFSEVSSCGRKIKRFTMHDLLPAFCAREAQNENLLHVVMSENSSDFPQKGFRWVSIQSKDFEMSTILSRSKSCRSFNYFARGSSYFNFKNFNLLRVFYTMEKDVRLKNNVDNVHLRFLWILFSSKI